MANTNGWERIAMNNLKNAYNWIVGGQENARDDEDITEEQFQNWIEKEALEQIYAEAITTLYTGDSAGGEAPKEMRFAGKNFCYKYLKSLFEEDGYNVTLETNKKEIKTMKNLKTYNVTLMRHNPQTGDYETTRTVEAVSISSARKKARELAESCTYGSMSVLDIQLDESSAPVKKNKRASKAPKTTKVVLKAFTGMFLGEYEAKVTKTGYTITTKKGDMEFNKDGTQKINCRNARFNSHIELLA